MNYCQVEIADWSVSSFCRAFQKKISAVLNSKFSYFLSAGNFAVNAETPDRIRAWESGTAPLRLASCAHFGMDAYQKSGQRNKELQKRNAQLEEENLILKKQLQYSLHTQTTIDCGKSSFKSTFNHHSLQISPCKQKHILQMTAPFSVRKRA